MARRKRVVERINEAIDQAEEIAERLVSAEERGLIGRVMDLSLHKKLLLARRIWNDPRTGMVARAPLFAGLAYAVLPIKAPPPVPLALNGILKVVGLSALLWLFVRLAPQDVVTEHLDELERGFLDRFRRRGDAETR